MKLKCVAKISSVYWQSNEESVESDKHQRIPVLESRETVVPKSRLLDKTTNENQVKDASTQSVKSAATSISSPISPRSTASSVAAAMSRLATRLSLYALPVLIAFLCQGRQLTAAVTSSASPGSRQSLSTTTTGRTSAR